jgi:hypothetical protein
MFRLILRVGIAQAMDYGLDSRGSIPDKGKRFSSTPQRQNRLWCPLSLLTIGHRGSFPEDKATGA